MNLWCTFKHFYESDMDIAVQYVDEAVDLIGFGTPLAMCLDHSPWPFSRKHILINIKMFHKYAYSPFADTNLPFGFTWVSESDVKEFQLHPQKLDPYMFYPHVDVYDGDYVDYPVKSLHGVED